MKTFCCGDVVPGCAATFTEADDELILARVAQHAASHHGIATPGADLVDAVRGKIRLA
jgi:predicted small metal-binding protein